MPPPIQQQDSLLPRLTEHFPRSRWSLRWCLAGPLWTGTDSWGDPQETPILWWLLVQISALLQQGWKFMSLTPSPKYEGARSTRRSLAKAASTLPTFILPISWHLHDQSKCSGCWGKTTFRWKAIKDFLLGDCQNHFQSMLSIRHTVRYPWLAFK